LCPDGFEELDALFELDDATCANSTRIREVERLVRVILSPVCRQLLERDSPAGAIDAQLALKLRVMLAARRG
jgi:hypothetical protein